jgi:segregation and condensation protein A
MSDAEAPDGTPEPGAEPGEPPLAADPELDAARGAAELTGELSAEPAAEPADTRRSTFRRRVPVSERSLLPASWQVHLPIFDGPLDLLLHLIKINRVEISDIPVATICDQFHAYLSLMEELNLDIAGEYIYEAALLIHLKSKLLLPRPATAAGEPEEDPRQELVERLLEYRRLKEAAQSLAEVDRLRLGIFTRRPDPQAPWKTPEPQAEAAEIDLGEVSLFDLLGALKSVLVRYDREHPPPLQLSLENYTVRGQFDRLLALLDPGHPFDMLEDLRHLSCRPEAIAAFLALLELARLSLVRVHQTSSGELLLYRTTRELDAADREAIQG